MTRRATKKMLRRAEQALREQRCFEAEEIYMTLMNHFESEPPSLLDYVACVFGLIRTFYATNRDEEARALAYSAYLVLSDDQPVEVAA